MKNHFFKWTKLRVSRTAPTLGKQWEKVVVVIYFIKIMINFDSVSYKQKINGSTMIPD